MLALRDRPEQRSKLKSDLRPMGAARRSMPTRGTTPAVHRSVQRSIHVRAHRRSTTNHGRRNDRCTDAGTRPENPGRARDPHCGSPLLRGRMSGVANGLQEPRSSRALPRGQGRLPRRTVASRRPVRRAHRQHRRLEPWKHRVQPVLAKHAERGTENPIERVAMQVVHPVVDWRQVWSFSLPDVVCKQRAVIDLRDQRRQFIQRQRQWKDLKRQLAASRRREPDQSSTPPT